MHARAPFRLSSRRGPLQQSSSLYIEFHIQAGPQLCAGIGADTNRVEWSPVWKVEWGLGRSYSGSSLWSGGALIERNESRRVPPGSGSVDRDEVDGLLWFAVVCFKTALIESRRPQTAACIGVTLLTHKLREHRPELPSPLLLTLSDKDDDVWDLDWCLNLSIALLSKT